MYIEIVKDNNELEQEVFRFHFDDRDAILLLDHYIKATRESKRHKFKPVTKYDRLMKSNCNIQEFEIPLTEEIRKQAFDKFVSGIKVLTQREYDSERCKKLL